MKRILLSLLTTLVLIFSGFTLNLSSKKNLEESFSVTARNPLPIQRKDEIIEININRMKSLHPSFTENSFIIFENQKEIPSQTEDNNGDGVPDKLLFLTSFAPNEKKEFTIKFSNQERKNYKKRTQAALGVKKNYKLINGNYTGGKFENIDSTVVPPNHVAHDALYRIEGPGWESELIAYRFYLDSRNRTDIFGKKNKTLIIDKIGQNDLISDSKESYTNMLDWGMDIFKVGESLGIGSIAMWIDNKPFTVSNPEKLICKISTDGPIRSDVTTKYINWNLAGKKFNLISNLSISAGSRLTKVDLNINDTPVMCTGLAKHENTSLLKSENDTLKWQYLALYGKQSLSGDNLGIAIFYNKDDFVKITEDSLSQIVILNTNKGDLTYYFAAAWEQEPNGLKTQSEFENYLHTSAEKLSCPVTVELH